MKHNPATINPANYTCAAHKVHEFKLPHPPQHIEGVSLMVRCWCSNTCADGQAAPGSKLRKKLFRIARRKAKQFALKEGCNG